MDAPRKIFSLMSNRTLAPMNPVLQKTPAYDQ